MQPVGKGKIGAIPKDIAIYLKLEDPERYTGHAFWRTSATILVDQGADEQTLKRHGGWKSSNVAQGYINESLFNKKNTSNLISNAMNLNKSKTLDSTRSHESSLQIKIVPATSKTNLTQQDCADLTSISQDQYNEVLLEQYDEVLETQIVQPQKFVKLNSSIKTPTLKSTMNVTKEDSAQLVTITQQQRKKVIQSNLVKPEELNNEIISQENLEEITSTNFFDSVEKKRPIFYFKNCTVNFNNSGWSFLKKSFSFIKNRNISL